MNNWDILVSAPMSWDTPIGAAVGDEITRGPTSSSRTGRPLRHFLRRHAQGVEARALEITQREPFKAGLVARKPVET